MAHPGGRPTKYDESWPDRVKNAMKGGDTVELFCLKNDIHYDTFYEWVKKYPEFSEAYSAGNKFAEGFWQGYCIGNLENKNLNVGAFKLLMFNCFGWSDKKDVQQKTEVSISEETQRKVREVLE